MNNFFLPKNFILWRMKEVLVDGQTEALSEISKEQLYSYSSKESQRLYTSLISFGFIIKRGDRKGCILLRKVRIGCGYEQIVLRMLMKLFSKC